MIYCLGAWNLDNTLGIYAADADSYNDFLDLFDPILKDLNRLKARDGIKHPVSDFGDLEKMEISDLDPENKFVLSTNIQVVRNHQNFAFSPLLTKEVNFNIVQCCLDISKPKRMQRDLICIFAYINIYI